MENITFRKIFIEQYDLIKIILPTIHCIIVHDTEIGSLFTDDRHQVVINLKVSSGTLYFGIRHLIRDACLVAPIKYFL